MGCKGLKGDRGIKDDAIFWLGHLGGWVEGTRDSEYSLKGNEFSFGYTEFEVSVGCLNKCVQQTNVSVSMSAEWSEP